MNEMKAARGLGWFSNGLEPTEVLAGRSLRRALGMEDREWLVRAFGVREIAAEVVILARDKPIAGVLERVAGDVLDLAVLGSAYTDDDPERDDVAVAIATVAGVTALDYRCARRLHSGRPHGSERPHRKYVADDSPRQAQSAHLATTSRWSRWDHGTFDHGGRARFGLM